MTAVGPPFLGGRSGRTERSLLVHVVSLGWWPTLVIGLVLLMSQPVPNAGWTLPAQKDANSRFAPYGCPFFRAPGHPQVETDSPKRNPLHPANRVLEVGTDVQREHEVSYSGSGSAFSGPDLSPGPVSCPVDLTVDPVLFVLS